MSEERPPHVTISTMPSTTPLTGVVTVGVPPRRWNTSALVMASLLTVAALAAAVFAVSKIRDNPGGAASPGAAVEGFFTAMAEQDVLGMLDMVDPGERRTFRQPLIDMVAEGKRLGLLDDTATLRSVAGVDIDVQSLRVIERPVTADIVNVDVRGVLVASADVRQLPLGDLVREWVADVESDVAVVVATESLDGLRITTVERSGRWYVSLFYSVAESLRLEAGLPPVASDSGVRASGSDSPEAAMERVLRALESLDLELFIAVLDPNEAAALQRYAPLFLDDAQAELDALGLRWRVDDVTWSVTVTGDRAVVVPVSLRIVGDLDGDDLQVSFDDDCLTIRLGRDLTTSCVRDVAQARDVLAEEAGLVGDDEALVLAFFDDLAAAFDDVGETGFVATRTNGAWYVSPIATVTEALFTLIRALDRTELDGLITSFSDAFTEVFDLEPPEAADLGPFGCLGSSDVDAVLACLDEGMGEGRFTAADIPAELRFPECGLAGPFVTGSWQMSDDDFIEMVEQAHVCFLLLALGGEIDPFEIPYEAQDPDCFGGVNPFAREDFREVDRLLAEVNACLSGS